MPLDPYHPVQSTAGDVTVEEISVPGPHGPIPLRIYRPEGRTSAALLWVHGGGFTHGDLQDLEAHMVSGELAVRAAARVASVGYRLARDGVHYPVPLDDVHAAWRWLCATSDLPEQGGAPIAIGGASAGAALATTAALRARDRAERTADALLLAYPFLHFPVPALDDATLTEMAELPASGRRSPARIEEMVRNYVGRITHLPSDAIPGAADLTGLPPTRIVVAQYDELRPSGELFERQLHEAGVPARCHVVQGMLHGFLNHATAPTQVDESLEFLAAALYEAGGRAGS